MRPRQPRILLTLGREHARDALPRRPGADVADFVRVKDDGDVARRVPGDADQQRDWGVIHRRSRRPKLVLPVLARRGAEAAPGRGPCWSAAIGATGSQRRVLTAPLLVARRLVLGPFVLCPPDQRRARDTQRPSGGRGSKQTKKASLVFSIVLHLCAPVHDLPALQRRIRSWPGPRALTGNYLVTGSSSAAAGASEAELRPANKEEAAAVNPNPAELKTRPRWPRARSAARATSSAR